MNYVYMAHNYLSCTTALKLHLLCWLGVVVVYSRNVAFNHMLVEPLGESKIVLNSGVEPE